MRLYPAVAIWLLLTASSAQAQDGCGYVSATTKPPAAKAFYPAVIREIDDVKVVERASGRIKLTVGQHRIAVQQLIAEDRGGKARLRELGVDDASEKLKSIEIEIKVDGVYLIAAQLIEDRAAPSGPDDYWEPVVWRKMLAPCN